MVPEVEVFAHVDDVVKAVVTLMETEAAVGKVFNIGSDQAVSILDLAGRVKRAMGLEAVVEHVAERREARHVSTDHAKLRATELGKRFRCDMPLPV